MATAAWYFELSGGLAVSTSSCSGVSLPRTLVLKYPGIRTYGQSIQNTMLIRKLLIPLGLTAVPSSKRVIESRGRNRIMTGSFSLSNLIVRVWTKLKWDLNYVCFV